MTDDHDALDEDGQVRPPATGGGGNNEPYEALPADHEACGGEPERSDSLLTFGAVVQAFRERAGLTQEEFAPLVGYAVSTVAAIEQGRRFPSRHFVDRAEEVLDAFNALRNAARHLSRKPGLAAWFRQWARLEQTALSLCTYECRLIPGLLQTEAYARAVFQNGVPPLSDRVIEDRVAERVARQQVLHENVTSSFNFLLEEALFHRHTGGRDVTHDLITHIVNCAERRHIELQIMPLEQPKHAALQGSIQLLETPEHHWLGYSEGQRSGQLISDPDDVSVLQRRYARMRTQALTPEDSVSLLKQMRGAL